MTRLAITSIVLGAVIVAVRVPGIVAPAQYRACAQKFPRSVLWGRILMAICAAWAGIVMNHAATDDWSWIRPLVIIGVPIAYGLVILYASQFLAIRAAAALLLLIAKVALDAADLSDAPLRLVVTGLAYLWVCAAMWMTIAPHQARDLIGWSMANNTRCRVVCSMGVGIGLALVALGLFIY
jgi:hypothetical protein